MTWHAIGNVTPDGLTEARVQLHYAIQFIAATGAVLAEPLPDYSHTSLVWQSDANLFTGAKIRATTPFHVALNPLTLTLMVINQSHAVLAALPLHQKTMADGLIWLKQEVAALGADASKIEFLDYPPDDFPAHELARGAVFDVSVTAPLQELANYYANTHALLRPIVASTEDATAIHIWPHHFDMATLIMLPETRDGNPLTVGVGLSPGDSSYAEPYWYVSPYPYPAIAQLPALAGNGFWHTQHWVGAVLTATPVVQTSTPEAQYQQVSTFLDVALKASVDLLKGN